MVEMKKTNIIINKLSLFVLVLGIVILLIGTTLATAPMSSTTGTTKKAEQYPSSLTIFWNNLKHSLGIQMFSVVGDSRSCGLAGGTPNRNWELQSGEALSSYDSLASNICGSGGGLYDFFTNGWTPFVEQRNILSYSCGTGPCNIELYCCPSQEPTSQSNCISGTIFTHVICLVSTVHPQFYRCPNENRIDYEYSSYNYCAISTTKTCWYKTGAICYSRNYDPILFPNPCESYTYNSLPLYSSESACLASACVPLWETGPWGACINGQQTRTVTDSNNCNTNSGKPATTQSCTTHQTEWWKCINGALQRQGNVSQGDSKWCSDSNQIGILDINNIYHCIGKYEQIPTEWCPVENPTQTCINQGGIVCSNSVGCKNLGLFVFEDKICCDSQGCGTADHPQCTAAGGYCYDGNLIHYCPDGQTHLNLADDCYHGLLNSFYCCNLGTINGTKPVGEICDNDIECITSHCDKSHWYSQTQTCQPTPWNEVIKVAATREDISQMTVGDAINIACLSNSECRVENGSYTAKCIPINRLKEDGTLSFSSDSFMNQAKSFVQRGTIGAGIGGLTGIFICAAFVTSGGVADIITAGGAAILTPAIVAICSATITGGAVIGATLATTISFTDKDPITAKINAGDVDSVGLCVKEPSEGDWCSIASKFGFFKITGDKCTDGSIIGGILLLLIIILLTRL